MKNPATRGHPTQRTLVRRAVRRIPMPNPSRRAPWRRIIVATSHRTGDPKALSSLIAWSLKL